MTGDSSDKIPSKNKQRDFKCSCGKTYLSNAALFTHRKQKHSDDPNIMVQKPKRLYSRRGRPSLEMKKQKEEELKQNNENQDQAQSSVKPEQGDLDENLTYQKFERIFQFLKEINRPQVIPESIWWQVQSFKDLHSSITNPTAISRQAPFKYAGVRMNVGLSQFLKQVLAKAQIWQVEQVILAFMLLLQYVVDQNNKKSLINEAPIEFLLQYVNPFIDEQIENYIEDFKIGQLWIMKRSNIIRVMYCFYNWLTAKRYTVFNMSINEHASVDF